MKKVIYVTGNAYKFSAAQTALEGTDIELVQEDLDTPEIQSTDVKEVASFSAKWASTKLNQPVLLTDGGFYFKGLNGFPGPFIKFVNKWLKADDFLRLMEGVEDRTVEIIECLAYCEPGKEPTTFAATLKGKIALEKGQPGNTSINEIFIADGFEKVESEADKESMTRFWAGFDYWKQFVGYLENK